MCDDDDDLDESRLVGEGRSPRYVRALWSVVALNAGMFAVGVAIFLIGRSVAVLADLPDFLSDATVTGIGLLLVGRSKRVRSTASLWQGGALVLLGLYAAGSAIWRAMSGEAPEPLSMGVYGGLALMVNVTVVVLMLPFREGDASVRAVWLYSRNDAISNVMVLAAGAVVWLTASRWPDVVAGVVIAALFLHSAWKIIQAARSELREGRSSGSTTAGDL